MKRIIIVNGLIAGIITSAMFLISVPLEMKEMMDLDTGMLIGYTSMVVGLSVIFFGIRSYRDQFQNGTITFWKGVGVGMLITLVASLIYATTWEIYSTLSANNFADFYAKTYVEDLQREGATQQEIDAAMKEMAEFKVWYANRAIRFAMTLAEILPVGILISVVAAAILRKRHPTDAIL